MPHRRALGLAFVLGLMGCSRDFYSVHGQLALTGRLGPIRALPGGCTRDPADGKPLAQSNSIATFLWADPALRNEDGKYSIRERSPNAPLRLEIAHDGPGLLAKLESTRDAGTVFDAVHCTTLRLDTAEHASSHPEGRPSLSGTLQMDCSANASHFTANLHFDHCEF